MFTFRIYFLFLLVRTAVSDVCSACPTGGIWSAWMSNDTCPTSCGACSNITRTRTCLSTIMGCPCVGETSSTYPCNTQACIAPQLNSPIQACCVGNSTMINNLYHCVPPPTQTKVACCPSGGYWTTWTAFVKATGQTSWKRTRTCVSENTDCPCTGNSVDIRIDCPCLTPTTLPADDMTCQNQANLKMSQYKNAASIIKSRPQIVVRPSRCEAYTIVDTSNNLGNFELLNGNSATLLFGNVNENGTCNVVNFPGAYPISVDGSVDRYTFTCNLATLRYEGQGLTGLYKVSQFLYPA